MSRARVHEVSSPISLFPFIGILLCTMGALLVVLVAVSRSAKDTAQREVHAKQQASEHTASGGVHQKLEEVDKYVGSLKAIRGEGERKLRDEQLRLGHVEDHIRRLQDKMQSLQTAAVELEAMEKEHYDDREQAEREISRLHKLIDESQKTITALQEAGSKDSRSYAVIPYEGPNGTFRRPIYIECVKNELVLQPEGVHIRLDDLRHASGAGNPLASVLRASRDYIVRLNPQAGKSRDTEPYPLLLVRPDGLSVYDRARQAIEAGDFDLGYELVESDWKVKYPQPDPQLADIQQIALDQSRARQAVLAAAAPQAYRGGPQALTGEFDFDDEPGGLGGAGAGPGGMGGSGGGGRDGGSKDYVVRNGRHGGRGTGGGDDDGEGSESSGESGSAGGDAIGGAPGGPAASGSPLPTGAKSGTGNGVAQIGGSPGAGDGSAPAGPNGATVSSGAVAGGGGNGGSGTGSPVGSVPDKNLVPDGYESASQGASVVAGSQGPADAKQADAGSDSRSEKERMNSVASRGKDWALREKPGRAVPVRRTIRVAVRNDQLAIVSDSAPAAAAIGKVIPMRGDTVESLDEFVKQVHDQIDGWGIAGNNLYWRPVILLDVGPDGGRRANDLTRLLKNSGLEIRTDETARNPPQGGARETR